MRSLAKDLNVLFVTASQLNRASVEEVEFDHSHISGGISKINTADNVIGIFTSRAMRERGRYQIQFMKTRSSAGVGQKVDLEFDQNSLRIRELVGGDAEQPTTVSDKSNDVMNKIKTTTEITSDEQPQKTIRADVQSSKLQDMLKTLKN